MSLTYNYRKKYSRRQKPNPFFCRICIICITDP